MISKIRHINQAADSATCGQTTLAMILGKTTEEVCKLMGKKSGTRTVDLIKILDKEKIRVKNRKLKLISKKNKLPSYAILHLRPIGKTKSYWGHWSVLQDGMVYDPATQYEGPTPLEVYLPNLKDDGVKITSFIELDRGE